MLFEAQFSPFSVWYAQATLGTADKMRLPDNGSLGCLDATII